MDRRNLSSKYRMVYTGSSDDDDDSGMNPESPSLSSFELMVFVVSKLTPIHPSIYLSIDCMPTHCWSTQ